MAATQAVLVFLILAVSCNLVLSQTVEILYLLANESARVSCLATPDTTDVSWTMDTGLGTVQIPNDVNQRIHVLRHVPSLSETLIITSVRIVEDFGDQYVCNVRSSSGPPLTTTTYLVNAALPPVSYLIEPPVTQTFTENVGETIELSCEADGAARPIIMAMWNITLTNGTEIVAIASRLTVVLSRENNGHYACILSNRAGSLTPINSTLIINYPPAATLYSPSLSQNRLAAGDTLNLSCSTNAQPAITFVEFVFVNRSVDSAVYQPEIVLMRMDSPGEEADFSISHIIPDVTRPAHSGVYYCRAGNAVGIGNSSLYVNVVIPPGAPQNLTLLNHTNDAVRLEWFPPTENGGDLISYYELNCTATTGIGHQFSDRVARNISIRNVTIQDFPAANLSVNGTNLHTFSGLFGGEQYDCRLSAINFAGAGGFSNNVTFTTLVDVPCMPRLSAEPRAQNICVSWILPCTGGEPITGCRLRRNDGVERIYSPEDDFCQADGMLKTFCDTMDLVPSQAYTYMLFVGNVVGQSLGSTSVINQDPVDVTATETILTAEATTGLSGGAIAGIIVAAVVVVLVIILITIIVLKSDNDAMNPSRGKKPTQPRVVADPTTEPTGLKYTKIHGGQTRYAEVETVYKPKEPAAAQPATPQKTQTQYAAVDAEKTRALSAVVTVAPSSDTIV